MGIFKKIFGDYSSKEIKRLRPQLEKTLGYEEAYKALSDAELKHKNFLRKTNYANKEIYITTAHLSPNIMREIGRLRELSFALEGGGTGKECDIDEFDTLPEPYCFKQLFVWSPEVLSLHPPPTSSITLTTLCRTICPTSSSWDEPSCSLPSSQATTCAKASTRSTTYGTDLGPS